MATPPALSDEVAALLRDARRRERLLLRQVADAAGVSTTLVSRLEHGHQRPSRETGGRLAEALKLADGDRQRLLDECGSGSGAVGPRPQTARVSLRCGGALPQGWEGQPRRAPNCRHNWTGPEYQARALKTRRGDAFVCKNCHGHSVRLNAAPTLLRRAREIADTLDKGDPRRSDLMRLRSPRNWADLDRLTLVVRSFQRGRERRPSRGDRRGMIYSNEALARRWMRSSVRASLCSVCSKHTFTTQAEINYLGRLNQRHSGCRGESPGRRRDPALVHRDFTWTVRAKLGGEKRKVLADEAGVSEDLVKVAIRETMASLPTEDAVGVRYRPYVRALLGDAAQPARSKTRGKAVAPSLRRKRRRDGSGRYVVV